MTRFLAYIGAAVLGLLPLNAQFIINPYQFGGSPPPSSTLKDSNTAASNGSTTFSNGGSLKYIGSGFVAGSSYTLTSVDMYMSKTGSPSFNITCEIWSNNSGDPGSIVGTGSTNSIAASSITGSEVAYTWTGLNASITSGTTYFIVLICDTTGDGSNNIQLYRNAVSANQIDTSANGSTWSNASATRRSKFATYGY